EAERDRLERRRRPGHADEGPSALDADRPRCLLDARRDELAETAEVLGRRWIGPDRALGEPDRTHADADRVVGDAGPVAEDELGGPSSDVEDVEGPVAGIESARAAEERERRLTLAGDHFEVGAGELADGVGEFLAVRGVARRARGADADAFGAERARTPAVPRHHGQRPRERFRIQPAGPVDALAETRDHHAPGELRRV